MRRSFLPLLVLSALCAHAQATDVYVWKVKVGEKVMNVNTVLPGRLRLSMVPFQPDLPTSPNVPGEARWSDFGIAFSPSEAPELFSWVQDVVSGKDVVKSVATVLFRGSKPLFAFDAQDATLTGLEIPGFAQKKPTNFAILLKGGSDKCETRGVNPLFEGGNSAGENPLFDGRIAMGDGSVRPIAMGPLTWWDTNNDASIDRALRPGRVAPVHFTITKAASAPFVQWFKETSLAVETGRMGDGSKFSRPIGISYLARRGTTKVSFSRCFIRGCEQMGDGSVRVLLQPDGGDVALSFAPRK